MCGGGELCWLWKVVGGIGDAEGEWVNERVDSSFGITRRRWAGWLEARVGEREMGLLFTSSLPLYTPAMWNFMRNSNHVIRVPWTRG